MRTVLLAWELGGGLGHAGPLLHLARGFAARGWRPVLAVRDVLAVCALDPDNAFATLQAPVFHDERTPAPTRQALSGFADILAAFGFADPDHLYGMVHAWRALLEEVEPVLILADHSPTLALTCFGDGNFGLIGNGFTLPPAEAEEFPALRSHVPPSWPQAALLDNVRRVQRRRSRPAPDRLPAILAAPLRAVCALPVLDPYAGRRTESLMAPFEQLPGPMELPVTPALFAYIDAGYANADALISALGAHAPRTHAYVRGDGAAVVQRLLASRGAHVHQRPPPLRQALAQCSVVLSHGGSATVQAALSAGRSQIVLPQGLEMELTAQALQRLGVGQIFGPDISAETLSEGIARALGEPKWRDHAAAQARQLAETPRSDSIAAILDRSMTLV